MAIVLVCVALLVGSVSQLLPVAERHPDKVAAWLSARAGQPVRFDQLQTRWTRRGPLLALKGLRIGVASRWCCNVRRMAAGRYRACRSPAPVATRWTHCVGSASCR
jgi:uncharacterized protein YhdP